MADKPKLTIVRIVSDLARGSTPLFINGRLRKRIPHNVDVEVDDAEFAALANSSYAIKIVGGAEPARPQPTGGGAGEGTPVPPPTDLRVEPFDAEATLAVSIKTITEDLDEFTFGQIEALLDAERRGQNRVTLIEALEKKLAPVPDETHQGE